MSPYSKQTWTDNVTPVDKAHMDHIEDGIVANDAAVTSATATSVQRLFDQKLAVPAASVAITGIPATFAHLRLHVTARDTSAANALGALNVWLNDDVGADYHLQYMLANGAGSSAGETISGTSFAIGLVTGGGCPAGLQSGNVYDILDYAGAGMKSILLHSQGVVALAASGLHIRMASGLWYSGAAVTKIGLAPASGSFAAGSRVTLYGLP